VSEHLESHDEPQAEPVPSEPVTPAVDDRPAAPAPTEGVPPTAGLDIEATIEALLFLSPDPLSASQLADACQVEVGAVTDAIERYEQALADRPRGVVLRHVGGGFALASAPAADAAARRLFAKPRTPPLTQAQAECLATIAYLQPISRPEVARIRGVNSESALGTLLERGLIEESGRTKLGAVVYRTTDLFERLFGLDGIESLPDVRAFDPSPEDEQALRDRLLRAGDARAGSRVAGD
jgi:segregation and condensation protein B